MRRQMGLASYYFTKNVDRAWRLLENLEAGMIGMNTGRSRRRVGGSMLTVDRQCVGGGVALWRDQGVRGWQGVG
jgi:acyl-CoA reductase-like NAD-dependent aldehyde dehydrogenase